MFRSMESGEEGFSIWSITGLIGAQMAAKAAIELNVFNIINEAGPEAQLSSAEIVSKIPTTNHKAAAIALDKILAMLTTKSILSSSLRLRPDHKQERIYGLTMASRTLVTNGGGVSIAPLVLFACEKEFVDSLYMAKETVLEPGCSPFRKAHGSDLFEYLAKNPRLSRMFNEEMECFSKILLHKVLKVYSGFQDVKELMDVGGGNGATLEKIVSIYPHVKGINFDLPHVVADAAISCPVFGILVLSGVVLLPLLLPLAATDKSVKSDDSTSKGAFNDLDKLSMGQVKQNSLRLWAFLIATYWVSFVAYYLLWKAYNHVSSVRASALMSPKMRAEQFVVLVRDIPPPPKGETIKEQVDSYFNTIYPDTYYRSMVVTNNKEVNKIWDELEGFKKKLARAEEISAGSKRTGNPEGNIPAHRKGFLGLVGEKVDSTEHYNEKINELIPKLEAARKVTLRKKQQGSALVFFTSRVAAASAAQSLHARMVDTWTVMEAPEPRQLIWDNLPKRFYERQIRQGIVYAIVALTIFFYMIPIGFISAFTTMDNLQKLLPFLKPVVKLKAIKTVLEAYLPQIVLIIFLALLPKFLLFLSKAEGIPSESHAVRAASGKYFYFIVLNVFIGVTVSGTLFDSLKSIEENPNSIVSLLAKSLPANATFFLTYVALKFFVGYGLELSRLVPLIIYHLKRKYICKTEADRKEAWAPGDLGYATRIPSDMLIITIVFCYSVIAPIIIPFGALYFGLGWLVLRNQVLKVYVPSYESYGRMWPHINSLVVAALLLFQVTTIGYFGIKEFSYAPFLIPLPILSLLFAYVCRKKFYHFFQAPALDVASLELNEIQSMELVFKSFIPPSLRTDRVEEDQFEDALSHHSRNASMHSMHSRTGSLA